jgi:hypothetical protein
MSNNDRSHVSSEQSLAFIVPPQVLYGDQLLAAVGLESLKTAESHHLIYVHYYMYCK